MIYVWNNAVWHNAVWHNAVWHNVQSIHILMNQVMHHEIVKDVQQTVVECMQVFITHNNRLYNKIDGIYYNLGKWYRNSWDESDDYVIEYDFNHSHYTIIDLKQNVEVVANSSINNEKYPFLLDSTDWYETEITHIDVIPNTKVKAIKIRQKGNNWNPSYNALTIAEIQMFPKSDPSMNIAPIYAKCYSFPVSIGIHYWC